MPDYFVMVAGDDATWCAIHKYNESVEDFTAPAVGTPLGDKWPDGLEYRMDKDTRGMKVPDLIPNSLGYTMMSAKFKTLLAARSLGPVEWRSFRLLNHKGRLASDDLWIGNPLTTIECVDRARTKGEPYPARPNWYFVIDRLNLLEDKIDPKLEGFRLGEMPRLIIVREDLKRAVEDAGIVGPVFHPMDTDVELQ